MSEIWPTLGKTQPRPDLGSCRPPSSRTAGPDGSGFPSHFHYPRVTISDLSQSRVLGAIGPGPTVLSHNQGRLRTGRGCIDGGQSLDCQLLFKEE